MSIEHIIRCDRCNELIPRVHASRRFRLKRQVRTTVCFYSYCRDFSDSEKLLCESCATALFEFLKVPPYER